MPSWNGCRPPPPCGFFAAGLCGRSLCAMEPARLSAASAAFRRASETGSVLRPLFSNESVVSSSTGAEQQLHNAPIDSRANRGLEEE